MADIKDQLIKDSYNYVLQSDLSTGVVYRIGGSIPVNPIFSSGLTINDSFIYSNGTEQNGYALLTDGTGYAYWGPISGASPSSGVTSITVGSGLSASSSTGAVRIVFTGSTGTSGDYLPLSGGTVTGATNFTNGLSANTISATTYYNLPSQSGTGVSSISYTPINGILTLTKNDTTTLTAGTFTYLTGASYSNNTITLTNNIGGTSSVNFSSVTGLTVNGNLTATGNTSVQGFTASTISATTLTIGGSSTFKGGITGTTLSGTTSRMVEASSTGEITANSTIITAYITSGGTSANLLENSSNWDVNGVYTGTTITGTYQGQKHYNENYLFEAVADNLFIRLIRG
jgi:hypothetical protein